MLITFFGTYNTKTTPRIQVMIDGLRSHDVEVNECNIPLKFSTADRVAVLRQPWRLPLLAGAIVGCWIKLILKARHIPAGEAIIIGHLGQFDIHLAKWLFRGKPLILDYMISGSATARDRNVRGGLKSRLLKKLDNSALRAANTIILDTEEHYSALPVKYQTKGIVVNVGAPRSWFGMSKSRARAANQPVRVVFFGVYTPLQGAPVIGKALSLLKHPTEVTMIGSGQDLALTKQAAAGKSDTTKITWIDWVESSELPRTVAAHDICLGIFGTGPKASLVVPNKVYQGSAVGCAIVTSDTPPQRRILEEAAVFVPAGDAAALAKALDELASNHARTNKFKQLAYEHAQEYFTPQKVVLPLLKKINSPV